MLLQLDQKHIYKVNFYPSDNNFTQALLNKYDLCWSRKHKNTSGMDAFGEEAYFLGRHVDAQDSKNKQIIKEFIVSIYVHNWGF